MLDAVKAIARAIAATNGHPDPDDYADQVTAHFASQTNPEAFDQPESSASTEAGDSAVTGEATK